MELSRLGTIPFPSWGGPLPPASPRHSRSRRTCRHSRGRKSRRISSTAGHRKLRHMTSHTNSRKHSPPAHPAAADRVRRRLRP
eukprot:scaffold144471_cov69-Phaeocystis_antarctica.AAC.1